MCSLSQVQETASQWIRTLGRYAYIWKNFEFTLQLCTLSCIQAVLPRIFSKLDLTDQELIQGFLNGGKKEYNQVVSWITAVIRSKLWSERVAADDVISDTTLKLLVNLREDSFRLDSTLKTYVQRITLYTLVDASRRVKRLDPLNNEAPFAEQSNPHSVMEEDERQRLFQRVVGMLPEKCRQLWVMAFEDGLKSVEIAKKIGSSDGAVRTSLSRCRDHASEILGKIS